MISDKTKINMLISCIKGLKKEIKRIEPNFVKQDMYWVDNYLGYILYLMEKTE